MAPDRIARVRSGAVLWKKRLFINVVRFVAEWVHWFWNSNPNSTRAMLENGFCFMFGKILGLALILFPGVFLMLRIFRFGAPAFMFTALAMMELVNGVAPAGAASLRATVELSKQRMHVSVDGKKVYTWPISTGKRGWETKPGSYTPFGQKEQFYSSKWNMSLPYLIWIGEDGTAIHGTYQANKLGRTASHGCIRLSIGNARTFYRLVERHGMYSTQVVVKR